MHAGIGWVLCDVQWHPRRAYVACCRRKNAVELWSKTFAEEWTAFAPNVQQLDRNVEYVEKEDEFDAVRCPALLGGGAVSKAGPGWACALRVGATAVAARVAWAETPGCNLRRAPAAVPAMLTDDGRGV